jgi:hypothetical protein
VELAIQCLFAGRAPGSSSRVNQRTLSRPLCAPAAAPRWASSANAGTTRRSGNNNAIPIRLPVFFPTQLQNEMTVLPQLLMDRGKIPPCAAVVCTLADAAVRRNSVASIRASIPTFRQRPINVAASALFKYLHTVLTPIARLRPICCTPSFIATDCNSFMTRAHLYQSMATPR